LEVDEQEATRFILLSPETNQEKIRAAIHERIAKDSDKISYLRNLDENRDRRSLKDRILGIKQEGIQDVTIGNPKLIEQRFLAMNQSLKPRHQRDVGRLMALVKGQALLNLWFRDRKGSIITANEDDIEEAFKIWMSISESQELNLPPFVFQIYREVILPVWQEKNHTEGKDVVNPTGLLGLSRGDVTRKHFQVYGRPIADWMLRQQVLPMLDNAGLIVQEADPNDKRRLLIYPSDARPGSKVNNSEPHGGGDGPSDLFTPPSDSPFPFQQYGEDVTGKILR
jgi:hypothetical protein